MATTSQKLTTGKEARALLKAQLAEYLAVQPETIQTTHKWMKRVEAAALGIVAAFFLVALYGSFTWSKSNPAMIPIAWFAFAACLSLMTMINSLHSVLIRAFPTVILPGRMPRFVSGSGAAWIGAASLLGGLVLAGFWVAFAYSTATFNMALLVPLIKALTAVISIGVVVSMIYSIYQKLTSPR
jgi:hypothetical protein